METTHDSAPPRLEVDVLLAAGRALGSELIKPGEDGLPAVLVPAGYQLQSLEALLPPQWVKAAPEFTHTQSFAAYVQRHLRPETTHLFVHPADDSSRMLCVFDYHAAAPGRCAHRATFRPKPTKDWQLFLSQANVWLTQVELALFLEDNAALFVDPPGAELLELVHTLHGHAEARFSAAVRLQTGAVRLHYDEDVVVRGGENISQGQMELPAKLVCGVAPFEGLPPYALTVRLRYTVREHKLSLRYEPVRPDLVVKSAMHELVSEIQTTTGLAALHGWPS